LVSSLIHLMFSIGRVRLLLSPATVGTQKSTVFFFGIFDRHGLGLKVTVSKLAICIGNLKKILTSR